jgi:hypothetical protein
MSWFTPFEGRLVEMPLDGNWMVATLEGQLPDSVVLTMDEERFQRGFVKRAVWTTGRGPFATLAYCGVGPTIVRHQTLEAAVIAKQGIDGGGCGGECCKVHIIVRADADNNRAARQQNNIRETVLSDIPRTRRD